MQKTKHGLVTIALFLFALTASAQDFSFEGIYYNITSSTDLTVEVTYKGRSYDEYSNEYTGAVTIPSAVVYYDNEIYKVTSIGDLAFDGCYGLTSITIPEGVKSIGPCAFYGCSSLTSITIPASVTSIGNSVFGGCSNLTSLSVAEGNVVYDSRNNCNAIIQTSNNTLISGCSNTIIPENVTSIGDWAFERQNNLTSITIPEGVTSIGNNVFGGCSNLTSLSVSEGNVVYDSRNNCNAIIQTDNNTLIVGCPSTIIPESVTSIGDYAFNACSGLTSITIPASVTNIGNYAFSNCVGLTSIAIPEGVTSIGGSAFSYCSGLTSITIPASVTNVGSRVLSSCSNLTSLHVAEDNAVYDSRNNCNAIIQTNNNTLIVGCPKTVIPEGVMRIGVAAFANCSSLTSITIPKSVTRIEDNAFYECKGLWTVINYSDLTILKRSRNNGYVGYYARRIINGEDIVNDYAFETIDGVHYLIGYIGDDTELTLPENFQGENYQLGDDAFYGCSSLTSITIPECVTSIGNSAFYGCSSLTSIAIPDGVTSIGNYAFYGCSSLTSIAIPDGVKSIGNYAFENCIGLTSITIPEGVTSIGYSAFSGCSNLESISINCSNAGSWFSGIQSIKKVVLGESVTSIGNSAFRYCSGLTSIIIPESVTEIGDDAFYYCSSLTSISIPDGVTSIGNSVFDGCSSLASITVPESVTEIGDDAFYNCSSLTSITIPEGVTSIGDYAFYDCSGLTSLVISKNIKSIKGNTFAGCSGLKELTLGEGLKRIEEGAFSSSKGLEKITIYATQPPTTGGFIFSDEVYENAALYVPQGCVSKYQVMTGWSGFYNISEIEGNTPNYLTIRQADNGAVKIAVDLGRTYKVQIEPSEGWRINSVSFDGVDMTAQLDKNNTFTTPAVMGGAVLNVAYEMLDDNNVTSVSDSPIKVYGHESQLFICGTEQGDHIAVYTVSGTAMAEVVAEGGENCITLPEGQLYIVKVADKVVKIQL